MFTPKRRDRRLRPPRLWVAAALTAAALGAPIPGALAQSYMSCRAVEADCEMQAKAMQDLISRTGTSGPYDYLYTAANCQSLLASAEQTSTWPAAGNGQPAFPCTP